MAENLLTPEEAAERLGITVRHLRSLRSTGQITYVRVGGSPRFRASDITDYIESRVIEAR